MKMLKKYFFLAGILLTNVAVMADLAVYVIVNDLYAAFPGFAFSSSYAYTPMLAPKGTGEFAISVSTAVYSFATFLSTYAVTSIQNVLGLKRFMEVIPIIAGIILLLLITEILLPEKWKLTNKKQEEFQ